jgi:Ca2+-dependent lipid-binding protein
MPIKHQNIRLKLMDYDEVGANELSGSIIIQTKDIINNSGDMNGKFIWRNFWGSPLN